MMNSCLAYALIATLSPAPNPSDMSAPPSIHGRAGHCIKIQVTRPARAIPRFPPRPAKALRPSNLLATPDLADLDDEIATPDESEDDRPDRLESALDGKGRTFDALLFSRLGLVPFKLTAPPPGARDVVAPEPKRPRFLSLCRLLI